LVGDVLKRTPKARRGGALAEMIAWWAFAAARLVVNRY
jgi:hypothetical protein